MSARSTSRQQMKTIQNKRGIHEDFSKHQTCGEIKVGIPDVYIVLQAEAGVGRSSNRKIPYIAIYNHNLKMHYTQDLGNHPDKVFRNLDVRANDVTAIVTGEKNKRQGGEQPSHEKDLIVIPPLHVKYGTYHQQRRLSSKIKGVSIRISMRVLTCSINLTNIFRYTYSLR